MHNLLFRQLLSCKVAVLLLLPLFTVAQNTATVNITTPTPNAEVFVYYTPYYLTGDTFIIAQGRANNDGFISLPVDLNVPTIVETTIQINKVPYSAFLESRGILSIDIKNDSTLNLSGSLADFNNAIASFDAAIANFLVANEKSILTKRAVTKAKPFADSLFNLPIPQTTVPQMAFISNYKYYRTEEFKLLTYISGKRSVTKNFSKVRIDYANPAYWDLFDLLFNEYIANLIQTKKGAELKASINERVDYAQCLAYIKADSLITNDTLAELVFVKGLTELYFDPEMINYSVNELLRDAQERAISSISRMYVNWFLTKIKATATGEVAPAFSLKDAATNETVTLADFKGSYVYLAFWDPTNSLSLTEVDLLKEFEKKFGRKVAFVCITNNPNAKLSANFATKNKMGKVRFLYVADDALLAAYNIEAMPAYVLIDREGKLLKNPASNPSPTLDRILTDLSKRK